MRRDRRIERRPEPAEDVVVKREGRFGLARRIPIDQKRADALAREVAHHALTRCKIEDVGAVDQRGHEERRRARPSLGPKVEQARRPRAPEHRRVGERAPITVVAIARNAVEIGAEARAHLGRERFGHPLRRVET